TQGVLDPISPELKSEPYIVANLAHAVLGNKIPVDWQALAEDYDLIRDLIAQTIEGFEDMNSKVRQPGGFYLPNGPRQAQFFTDSGKAKITINTWQPISLKDQELLMMTIRSHDQFNTTIYGLNDRYRGIFNERRIIFMHPEDMALQHLQQYDIVDLYSHYEGIERTAKKFIVIPYAIARHCVATYFPEANPLVPLEAVAEKSHTPISKSVVITLLKVGRYDKRTRTAIYEP
ncbi:MAG TPA: molybdopterin dinucleotide binding domain-containing protein, partial [Cytophagales bacterium]|nr:molybdopterin dinucleotide binding domain-containing protein [Cytophagales bacterium]